MLQQNKTTNDKSKRDIEDDSISDDSAIDDSCPSTYPWSIVLLLLLSTVTIIIIFAIFSIINFDTGNTNFDHNHVQFYERNEFAFKIPNKLSIPSTSGAKTLPSFSQADKCNQSPVSTSSSSSLSGDRALPLRISSHNQLHDLSYREAKKKQVNINVECLSLNEKQTKTSLKDFSTHHHRFGAHRSSSWMSSADQRTSAISKGKSIHYLLAKSATTNITTITAPTISFNFGSSQLAKNNPEMYYHWPDTFSRRYQMFNSRNNGHRVHKNKAAERRFWTRTTTTTTEFPSTPLSAVDIEAHSSELNLPSKLAKSK